MADYSFLANGYQTPDPFAIATKQATLGNLSNQYTAGQIANTGNAANLTELQNYRALMQNPPKDANGNIDQDALAQQAQRVAPTLGAGLASGSADAQTANARAKLAHFQVDQGYADAALKSLGALQGDPRIVGQNGQPANPTQAAEAIAEQEDRIVASGVPRAQAKLLTAPFYMAAGHNPQLLPQLVNNTLKAAMGAQGTAAANTPNLVGTGGQNVNISPFANQGTQPASIPNTLPPGGQDQVATDVNNNLAIIKRSPTGQITGAAGVPGGGGAPPVTALPPNESPTTQKQLQDEWTAAKNAQLNVRAMHTNNQGILDELQNVTATGQAGGIIAKAESLLGAGSVKGSTDAERAASAYDLLGKYATRNALMAAQNMGPGTNAGLDAQIKANGSESFNPTALRKVTLLNDAAVTGADKYATGLSNAIGTQPNGIFNKRTFDQQWSQNASPEVLQYINAIKSGDAATKAELEKKVGPALLNVQLSNLKKLTEQGHL